MTSIATLGPSATQGIWEKAAERVARAQSVEEASHAFLDAVYGEFEQGMVLARVFLTVSFDELPPRNQEWVRALARRENVEDDLRPGTPVLSLIGTRGKAPAWNDIRQSEGHVGIPLVSTQFVEAIPMVARLLTDLGLGADLGVAKGATASQGGGSSMRTFYVADAANTTDDQGRKIIAMQDFVREHGVKTVFGGGGPYSVGSQHVLACIFFTTESIDEDTARAFEPVLAQFRDATRGVVEAKHYFG